MLLQPAATWPHPSMLFPGSSLSLAGHHAPPPILSSSLGGGLHPQSSGEEDSGTWQLQQPGSEPHRGMKEGGQVGLATPEVRFDQLCCVTLSKSFNLSEKGTLISLFLPPSLFWGEGQYFLTHRGSVELRGGRWRLCTWMY